MDCLPGLFMSPQDPDTSPCPRHSLQLTCPFHLPSSFHPGNNISQWTLGSAHLQPRKATYLTFHTGDIRGRGGSKSVSGSKNLRSKKLRMNSESLIPEVICVLNKNGKQWWVMCLWHISWYFAVSLIPIYLLLFKSNIQTFDINMLTHDNFFLT